jgi:uncharacterized protein YndB with AHSA1/START domain
MTSSPNSTEQQTQKLKTTKVSDREIVMTREFDAPRRLVFDAWTKAEHVSHWWGQKGSTLTVDALDLRVGGKWRFIEHAADGNDYAFRGEYREIVPPERLVYTFEFEGVPGHIVLTETTFEERDGKTMQTDRSTFASPEDLQGMMDQGMEQGAGESMDRLEAYLATMAR